MLAAVGLLSTNRAGEKSSLRNLASPMGEMFAQPFLIPVLLLLLITPHIKEP